MCAPAIIPILTAVGGIATAASQLGIVGNNRQRQQIATPQRQQTAPPPIQSPTQAASAAGDDELIKPESVEVKQNAKQKRDKQTVKKGTLQFGALPGINTGVAPMTPPQGVNAP